MLCRYKCLSCNEWHELGEVPTNYLPLIRMFFLDVQPEPFTASEWMQILAAEIKRRGAGQ